MEENVEMINPSRPVEHQSETTDNEEDVKATTDKLPENPRPAFSKKKQRQLGPAPIASFEDISDEVRQKVCITPPTTP